MNYNLCELPAICKQCHCTLTDAINKAIEYSKGGFYYAGVYCEHDSVLAIAEIDLGDVRGISLHAPLTIEQAYELMEIKTSGVCGRARSIIPAGESLALAR